MKLDVLQNTPPLPEKPFYCEAAECLTKPICYTNYQPHYNPQFLLDSLIVGSHAGWNRVEKDGQSDVQNIHTLVWYL